MEPIMTSIVCYQGKVCKLIGYIVHYHHHPECRWMTHFGEVEVLLLKVAGQEMDQTSARGQNSLCTQTVHHQ